MALNGTDASPWPPVLDGDFIADYPGNQLADGRFPKIPILIGCNADEGTAFAEPDINTDEDMRAAIVEDKFGNSSTQTTGKTVDELVDELMYLYPNIQAVGDPGLDKFPAIQPGDENAETLGLQYRRSAAFFGDA